MFHTEIVDKITTDITFSINYFQTLDVYEVRKKNILERVTPQKKMWLKRIAFWVPKATNARSEYAILIDFPPQQ